MNKFGPTIDLSIIGMLTQADQGTFEDSITRECGECNVCCVAPSIKQPDLPFKPAGKPCEHCTAKGGCGIYDSRPELCKSYLCLYLTEMVDHRPDSDGVAWTLQEHPCPGGMLLLMGHCKSVADAVRVKSVMETLKRFLDKSDMITSAVLRDGKYAVSWLDSYNHGEIMKIDSEDNLLPDTRRATRSINQLL